MNEDRSARYHRLRRRAAVLSVAASAAFVALLALTRWGAAWPLAGFVALIALGAELASFPFDVYRDFLLERKYGLSSQSFRRWLAEHIQAVAIGLAIWEVVAFGLYAAMRWTGNAWWLAATGLFAAAVLVLSRIGPVVLIPIFERVRPLERAALRARLLSLSRKAGVPAVDAFEWGVGGPRANAALAGLGRSRRILLTDSLLKDYSDDEIEVILAHELAHYVHHDMAIALLLESAVVAAAVLTAHLVVTALGYAPADRAALPLILLAAGAAVLLLMPLGKAWSRRSERRADRYALALTGRQDAFVSAMRRLGAQHLAEPDPSGPAVWFFHTHPTIDERIAAARDFTAA